jgi:hypothetical protein
MDVEAWLDDKIEIVDRPDLDPLDKRVRIDARRWIMPKVAPPRLGDKVILAATAASAGSAARLCRSPTCRMSSWRGARKLSISAAPSRGSGGRGRARSW